MIAGVITGDIVNSGNLSEEEHSLCLKSLEKMMANLNDLYGVKGDIFRGDEFQVFVRDEILALRIAVVLRLCLMAEVKGADARVSIGIGSYGNIADEIRKTAKGEAFELSGRGLSDMKDERISVSVASNKKLSRVAKLLITYLDFVLAGVSCKQAEILLFRVLYPENTHEELSVTSNIPRRTVASRLQRSNATLILETISVLEEEIKGMIKNA